MSEPRVYVYQDREGKWRWREWRGSRIVADSGEGYENRAAAIEMARKATGLESVRYKPR